MPRAKAAKAPAAAQASPKPRLALLLVLLPLLLLPVPSVTVLVLPTLVLLVLDFDRPIKAGARRMCKRAVVARVWPTLGELADALDSVPEGHQQARMSAGSTS